MPKKKTKRKRKEKRIKKNKGLLQLRDDIADCLDSQLLSLTRKKYDSFKDYKKDMESFTYRDIFVKKDE